MKLQLSLIISSFLLFSCQEISNKPKITDIITTAQDEGLAESLFEDANQESDKQHAETESGQIKSELTNGPTVTIDGGENGFLDSTWTVTVDFGEGVTGRNNWVRKGKIQIEMHGKYKDEGSYRITTFENYYVNNNKVEGTHTVENLGFDSVEMCMTFSVKAENGKITTDDGKNITWESTRIRKWIAGYNTVLNIWDDVYEITGDAEGINSKGDPYTKTITEPLRVEVGCPYIQNGKLAVSIDNSDDVIIDYGYAKDTTETCNDDGEITYNGKQYQYKMQRGK